MKYACVMRCEGTKTYPEPGKCPVCGMKLAPVEQEPVKKQDEHAKGHDHGDHSHGHCC